MEPTSVDRGAAADLWRNTLNKISGTFGKLVYLAGLRDPSTGAYRHFGLEQRFGESEAQQELRRSHEAVFQEWLDMGLARQKAEVEAYLSSLEEDPGAVVRAWLELRSYRGYPPEPLRAAQREHFLIYFEAIVELLKTAYGVSFPDPDA